LLLPALSVENDVRRKSEIFKKRKEKEKFWYKKKLKKSKENFKIRD